MTYPQKQNSVAQKVFAAPDTGIETTLKERGGRYGDFREHAQFTDDLLSILETSVNWHAMPPYMRQGLRVICDKIARMSVGELGYLDNWHDITGYATLVEERLKQDEERRANGPGLPLEGEG